MNWFAAQTLMESARDKSKGKPIANNTRLWEIKNPLKNRMTVFLKASPHEYIDKHHHANYNIMGYEIKLHGNVIMTIYRYHIELSSGGWKTLTTKERLNRYLPNGFKLYQKNWEWYIEHGDKTYDFDDVLWIHNDGRVMLSSTYPNYPSAYNHITLDTDWKMNMEIY
jgi:hypothetical protein